MSDPDMRRALLSIAEGYRRLAGRAVIDGSAFSPEALKMIWEAFDAAWAEIAGNLGNDEIYIEAVR